MTKFIILATPAVCIKCGRVIRAGRGAFWSSSAVICYTCMTRGKGQAEESEEERQAVGDLMDGISNG